MGFGRWALHHSTFDCGSQDEMSRAASLPLRLQPKKPHGLAGKPDGRSTVRGKMSTMDVFSGMTPEEFEAWWSQGPSVERALELNQSQRAQALKIKLLFKQIATRKDIDAGLTFALMGLASDLYVELVRREAYLKGRHAAWGEVSGDFLGAIRTLKSSPLAFPAVRDLAAAYELASTAANGTMKRRDDETRHGARAALAKTRDPLAFLRGLMFLDSMPGAKSRYLRSFFACLFMKQLKHGADLVGKVIQFCFREQMKPGTLREARRGFNELFPNWPGVSKRLLATLQAPRRQALPRTGASE
jgi:hypothetical protein